MQQPEQGRRKSPGGGPRERRYGDVSAHARDLDARAADAIETFVARTTVETDFDPKLIMKFELNARVSEVDFARSGLAVLDSSSRHAAVVFADDAELSRFRSRLASYQQGPPPPDADGKEHSAPLEGFFDAIDGFRPLQAEDRISARLAAELEIAGGETTFDLEFWFVPDRGRLEDWMSEAKAALEAAGGAWLDSLILTRSGVAIARGRGTPEAIRAIAELDQIALADCVPKPQFSRTDRAQLQDIGDLEIEDPPSDAPVIGIVDSGVAAGHPLLEPAVAEAVALHEEFGEQAEDGNGHGSMVAGIVLYGDVLESAKDGVFRPSVRISSVRALDDDCAVPEHANFVRVLRDAVVYLVETWQCRVINISIGDADSPYSGGKSTPTAAMLDNLARAYDVVIVVAAGNRTLAQLQPHAETVERHPNHLLDEDNCLLDPAQASIALTVGAISSHDGVESRTYGTSLGTKALAEAGHPAPFTRSGPGVENSIKPELVANGGNLSFDSGLGRLVLEKGASVVSTSHRPAERLFDSSWGTSFAAPFISHIAGELVHEYPELSANSIRALLLQGAQNGDIVAAFEPYAENAELERAGMAVAGYGAVTIERSAFSQPNRVVMFAEERIRPDDFHVFRVPLTDAFAQTAGPHEVSIALAFDPPVRHRRFDYLAHKMEFLVVRGIDAAEVYRLASADAGSTDAPSLSKFAYAALRPPTTTRARGTNQMAVAHMSRRPLEKHSDDWFVVVRSINRWLSPDEDPQNYSIAIALEASNTDQLYAEVEARLEAEVEVLAAV